MSGVQRAAVLSALLAAARADLSTSGGFIGAGTGDDNALPILKRAVDFYGPELVGPYIVSMTHGSKISWLRCCWLPGSASACARMIRPKG